MTATLWDKNGTRYHLASTNPGPAYNWLIVPGGPGFDSRYMMSLLDLVDLPGNTWLIDLPDNGDNTADGLPKDLDFNNWLQCVTDLVKQFENPVYVGHSAGGMYPLLLPELEKHLKGLVLLGSASQPWATAMAEMAVAKNLPDLGPSFGAFLENPTAETCQTALPPYLQYTFPQHSLEKGQALLSDVPLNYFAIPPFNQSFMSPDYTATWIPEKIPTLILGGSEDCCVPQSVITNDARFKRENIQQCIIDNAGHLPWLESPEEVRGVFEKWMVTLRAGPGLAPERPR